MYIYHVYGIYGWPFLFMTGNFHFNEDEPEGVGGGYHIDIRRIQWTTGNPQVIGAARYYLHVAPIHSKANLFFFIQKTLLVKHLVWCDLGVCSFCHDV